MVLKIGDSVVVNKGVKDPDLGNNIGAWQGRISEIDEDLVCIDWDSITLQQMPASSIIHSEEEGWEWQKMYLSHSDVTLTKRRDSIEDVDRVFEELSSYYMWVNFEEQGKRIQSVLSGISRDDDLALLRAWRAYLQEKLTFPFQATVMEMMLRGNRSDPSHFFYAARGRGGTSSPWRRAVITSARYFHGQALRFLHVSITLASMANT